MEKFWNSKPMHFGARARGNVVGTVLWCCCGLEGGDCVRYGDGDDGDRGGVGVGHCYPAGDPIYGGS